MSIDGRIKRLWSIHQKLQRQQIPLDQVYDFIALRIITNTVKDCYSVLGLIHQMWSPVPGRFKDFIATPRPNGYQSLHTSVVGDQGMPFEVQIRTADMHRIAEEGIAAHWKYKEGRVSSAASADRDEQYFIWLRRLLELQQEVRDPQEFMQNLRIELYPDEVYIFTPKGEVKSLPARFDARGLRVPRPYRRRPPMRRRARQRPHGAAAHAPDERRHRRGRHAVGAHAESRLAELRRHVARAEQDPPLHPVRGKDPQPRSGPTAVREGPETVRRRQGARDR